MICFFGDRVFLSAGESSESGGAVLRIAGDDCTGKGGVLRRGGE